MRVGGASGVGDGYSAEWHGVQRDADGIANKVEHCIHAARGIIVAAFMYVQVKKMHNINCHYMNFNGRHFSHANKLSRPG